MQLPAFTNLRSFLVAGCLGIAAVMVLFTSLAITLQPRSATEEASDSDVSSGDLRYELPVVDPGIDYEGPLGWIRPSGWRQYKQFFELTQLPEAKIEQFMELYTAMVDTSVAMASEQVLPGVRYDVYARLDTYYTRSLRKLLGDDYERYTAYNDSISERTVVNYLIAGYEEPGSETTREASISFLVDERKYAGCPVYGRAAQRDIDGEADTRSM